MALTCPMVAGFSDKRQRDYLDIDEIDGRVWSETLRCWVLKENLKSIDLSCLINKFNR